MEEGRKQVNNYFICRSQMIPYFATVYENLRKSNKEEVEKQTFLINDFKMGPQIQKRLGKGNVIKNGSIEI